MDDCVGVRLVNGSPGHHLAAHIMRCAASLLLFAPATFVYLDAKTSSTWCHVGSIENLDTMGSFLTHFSSA